MTQFLFANNASTTLASSVAPTDTVIQVASGTGALFPNPGAGQQFAVTFQDAATGLIEEIAYCTAVSGDNLTVVRGREGTVARSWNVGDDLSNYWTAGSAAAFVQLPILQAQATNFANDVGSANAMSCALTPAITAYSEVLGAPIRIFKNAAANTGNVTLTVNGLGPLPVLLPGGSQVPSGYLSGSSIVEVVYDGTRFEVISVGAFSSPGGPAGGDLTGTYPNPVVGSNKISNGKLAQVPAFSFKGNNTNAVANAIDMTVAQAIALLGTGVGIVTETTVDSTIYTVTLFGFIFKFGITTRFINTESTQSVTLPTPFPTACLWTGGNTFNTSASALEDIWLQSTNSSTASTIVVYCQGTSSTPGHVEGFTWMAVGH